MHAPQRLLREHLGAEELIGKVLLPAEPVFSSNYSLDFSMAFAISDSPEYIAPPDMQAPTIIPINKMIELGSIGILLENLS